MVEGNDYEGYKPYASLEEYEKAVEEVRHAASVYYNSQEAVIDDATYDKMLRSLSATEILNPEWKVTNSPTDLVGSGGETGDVPHTVPMLSLGNVFSAEKLTEWQGALAKRLGRSVAGFTVEPKMDGSAISARYKDGRLVQLITRGDGTAGEDVTHAGTYIEGLPLLLNKPVSVEVRGEALFTDAQFEEANEIRLANGEPVFANARNGAAGTVRAKGRAYELKLTFYGYQAVHLGTLFDGDRIDMIAHSEAMALIESLGINTTGKSTAGMLVAKDFSEVLAYVEALGKKKTNLGFEVDGAVIKADSYVDRADAGFSSKAPHWATAYKYPADVAMSVLEEVMWQVGRTGVITPRARIVPVEVGGTTVTYATLHNAADIVRKDIRLHDSIFVKRAGEVIPRIEGPVLTKRTGDEIVIAPPATCPNCGGTIDKSQVRWRCTKGRECRLVESIEYAVARDGLDITGIGDKLAEQLVTAGLVKDIADIFALTRENLLSLDRKGELSVSKVLQNIEAAKNQPLSRVLVALGIRGTGRSMSRRLAKHFNSMAALCAASEDDLSEVNGIGKEKAPLIVEELLELAEVIEKLRSHGVNMEEASASEEDAPLQGMTVVVTGGMSGALAALSRNEMNELIEKAGGKSSGSVSKNTSLLVAGTGAGSKKARAEELGVPVETPEEFAIRVESLLD